MSEKCCSTCRNAQVKGNKFECHFAPPPVSVLDDAVVFKPKVHWPVMKSDDWCSRWNLGVPRP